MNITFCCTNTPSEPWLAGLRHALPGAEVTQWQPGDAPADMAVVWMPPPTFWAEQTRLSAVFNIGAGVDALMSQPLPAGVRVVRLEDAGMAVQMAEYVCHAVMGYFREWAAIDQDMRAGHWQQREPGQRADWPVGVMGLGVLGERVARALQVFEFPVNGYSRSPKTIEGVSGFVGPEAFHDFLAHTRVLVNLLPLTPETENILNRDTLSRLRPGAFVINVARGRHLVDEDLLALLDSGHVAGATLDVFRTEPLPPGHAFWQHPRIRLTPHTSARTLLADTVAQIAHKVAAVQRGEPVRGEVDVMRGY
jgi:glyoxylate/hydroxypyruvate reductase